MQQQLMLTTLMWCVKLQNNVLVTFHYSHYFMLVEASVCLLQIKEAQLIHFFIILQPWKTGITCKAVPGQARKMSSLKCKK